MNQGAEPAEAVMSNYLLGEMTGPVYPGMASYDLPHSHVKARALSCFFQVLFMVVVVGGSSLTLLF